MGQVKAIYTEYVRDLAGGKPPDRQSDEEVCRQLRVDLRWALARRGLWHASPSLLGVVGTTWTPDLLEDLVHDAYLYNFADRLWHLHDRVRLGADLRPLVLRNLENFLSERQRALDPIGHRIFVRFKAALRGAVARGELFLLNATPAERDRAEIDNLSLLGFSRGLAAVAAPEELAEAVRGWPEDLFTDLVGAETNAVAKTVARLERHVVDLKARGIRAFRFKDLVDLLKLRARRRWEAAVAEDLGESVVESRADGGPAVPVVIVRPDDEPDGARRLVMLVHCVSRRIAELADGRTRDELRRLWEKLRATSAEGLPRPSLAKLGKELGIARERRLPKLLRDLGEMVEQCRECLGRRHGGPREGNALDDHGPKRARPRASW